MKLHITGQVSENGTVVNAKGGTEMMAEKINTLITNLGLTDQYNIIHSRVRELDDKKKNVLVLHDTWNDPEAQHLKSLNSRNRFHKLVFVSNYQFQTYHLAHGIKYNESLILKNAITPIQETSKPTDRINIIYHTTPHRGLELLVPVFEVLYEKYKDRIHLDVYSSFSIYGWPQRDEQYKELFNKIKNHPGMTYHGAVPNEEVRAALQNAHIFAYPNIWPETSCIAAMEAMSAGCIVVCPNHAALPETTAGFAYMYQHDEDPHSHMQKHFDALDDILSNESHIHQKNVMQKLYADNFYSWEYRSEEWKTFLLT